MTASEQNLTSGARPFLSPPEIAFSDQHDQAHQSTIHDILGYLRNHDCLYSQPAYVSLCRLATFDGRLSFNDAADSLLPYERALLQALVGRKEYRIAGPGPVPSVGSRTIGIRHSSFGKVSFYPIYETDYPSDEDLIGELEVERHILEEAEQIAEVQNIIENDFRNESDEILFQWSRAGELPDKLIQVQRWINQFDALYIYIDRRLYSRAAGAISTLASASVFDKLASTDPKTWRPEDRLFVVAAHILAAAGGVTRLEEFNGKQLTASTLRVWLYNRYRVYRDFAEPGRGDRAVAPTNLLELASSVGKLSRIVDSTNWARYRQINGLTLVKKEHIFRRRSGVRASTYPPSLRMSARLGEATGPIVVGGLGQTLRPALDSELLQSIKNAAASGNSQVIQDGLEALLRSALLDLDAEFVMSSGIRNPRRLDPTSESYAGPMSLKKVDFYCCVLPSEPTAGRIATEELGEILLAIARRMEFNRWHFIPGNFRDEDIPRNRHYFRPPLLPDLTEWSNFRHGGHVQAQVCYSIRLPGPPAWSAPLRIFGQEYRGIYDIRAFRTGGRPFNVRDLEIGVRYSDTLYEFVKVVYSRIESMSLQGFFIDRYSTEWYREARWLEAIT